MLVTLLGASLGLNAEDRFYIPDFDIAAGESKQIAIHYESSEIDKRCGFQFDLYLPEGLTVEKKKNKYNFTFNTDRNDDHTMSSSDQPDGAIRVVGISMSSAQFWEAAGEFIYFTVTAASDFAGSHEITISEIQFSDLKGTLMPVADSKTVINPGGGEIPATGITLDKTTAEMTEGETLTLTATVTPEDATDKTVTWTSSDETVATVANGVVTALKAGKATITAKSGEVSATCEITVNAKVIPATGISLDKTTAEMIEGEILTLTATVTPEDATDKTVTWTSSDETVATVANGVVTALKAGKATITAKSGEVSATCEITVNAKVIPATGIALDKTTAELTEGETLTLTATVTPEDATDKTVTWTSSDETVATVKNGVVTALKAGKATITAKSGEVSATCEITVNAKVIPATNITLDKTTAELTEGEILTLTATVTPEDATDKTVTWTSSDETVAKVVNGVVSALKTGKATITAKSGEVSATCEITVNAKVIPATGIALDKTIAELTEGETLTLTATVTPEDATDKTVVWTSSDETVATVANGVVTALKAGKATITAKVGDVSATCEITVNAKVIPATGIALDKTTAEMTEGETLTLTATVTPEDATDKTIVWSSSDETIATVANGVVTALKAGKTTITAKAGEVSATCEITVNAKVIPATGIALDKTIAELTEGETLTLTATVTPEDATDKTVVWTSSDETVATVANGVVTALKAGKATITAKVGDVSATCEITVNAKVIPATGIALDKTTAEMTEGETLTLTATVTPEDATDKTIVWSSSDETIATVANGLVTALKAGQVTITATNGGHSATCELTVNAKVIPATGIALDKTTAEMTEGETLTLTATVTPEDATDKTVTWTSSDETVVKVVNGVVSALKTGKATITATSGDVSATCEITVIPVTGINGVICSDGYAAGNVYTVAGNLVCRKGEKLNSLPKGLYIVDGKKIVVK